jgi:hypothetical protein
MWHDDNYNRQRKIHLAETRHGPGSHNSGRGFARGLLALALWKVGSDITISYSRIYVDRLGDFV